MEMGIPVEHIMGNGTSVTHDELMDRLLRMRNTPQMDLAGVTRKQKVKQAVENQDRKQKVKQAVENQDRRQKVKLAVEDQARRQKVKLAVEDQARRVAYRKPRQAG